MGKAATKSSLPLARRQAVNADFNEQDEDL
jgi:hypothetical protein